MPKKPEWCLARGHGVWRRRGPTFEKERERGHSSAPFYFSTNN
jgi:hypothetical protein